MEKIGKIVIYVPRVNGGSKYEYPRQRWVQLVLYIVKTRKNLPGTGSQDNEKYTRKGSQDNEKYTRKDSQDNEKYTRGEGCQEQEKYTKKSIPGLGKVYQEKYTRTRKSIPRKVYQD